MIRPASYITAAPTLPIGPPPRFIREGSDKVLRELPFKYPRAAMIGYERRYSRARRILAVAGIVLIAVATFFLFASCAESEKQRPTYNLVVINGQPHYILPGARIINRDPKTGRFTKVRIEQP